MRGAWWARVSFATKTRRHEGFFGILILFFLVGVGRPFLMDRLIGI